MIWINSRLALRGFEEAYDMGSKSRGSIVKMGLCFGMLGGAASKDHRHARERPWDHYLAVLKCSTCTAFV